MMAVAVVGALTSSFIALAYIADLRQRVKRLEERHPNG